MMEDVQKRIEELETRCNQLSLANSDTLGQVEQLDQGLVSVESKIDKVKQALDSCQARVALLEKQRTQFDRENQLREVERKLIEMIPIQSHLFQPLDKYGDSRFYQKLLTRDYEYIKLIFNLLHVSDQILLEGISAVMKTGLKRNFISINELVSNTIYVQAEDLLFLEGNEA